MSRFEMQADDGTAIVVAAERERHTVTVSLSLTRGTETMTAKMSDEQALKLGDNIKPVVVQA